jgi:K+-transporting ATPase KdpF subunit
VYGCVFWPGDFVFEGLRTPEVKFRNKGEAMLGNILLIVISILLCGYLFYALLKPEKF